MQEVAISWLGVIAATLIVFILGALWYGPLFGKAWIAATGVNPEDAKRSSLPVLLGITFVLEFLMAWCLAMFLGNAVSLAEGALYGFLTGFFWIAFALAVNALFEQKSFRYLLINCGYWVVSFTLMGLVIAWLQAG